MTRDAAWWKREWESMCELHAKAEAERDVARTEAARLQDVLRVVLAWWNYDDSQDEPSTELPAAYYDMEDALEEIKTEPWAAIYRYRETPT